MLAELGVEPKQEDAGTADSATTTGKKKKKKDKALAKDGETVVANGNGAAPVQQSKPDEQQNEPPAEVIEVDPLVHYERRTAALPVYRRLHPYMHLCHSLDTAPHHTWIVKRQMLSRHTACLWGSHKVFWWLQTHELVESR